MPVRTAGRDEERPRLTRPGPHTLNRKEEPVTDRQNERTAAIPPWGWGVLLILGLVFVLCCMGVCAGILLPAA